jgi:hypothetical protein
VTWRRYDCTGGVLSVQLRSDNQLFKKAQTLVIGGTTAAQTLKIAPGSSKSLRLPLTPSRGICRVDFAISPTHRPVDYEPNVSDTRQLGLHFDSIRYRSPAP